MENQNRPTVVPHPNFNPRGDAEVIHKACKGLGTDEKGIINILCRRTFKQRQEIAQAYRDLYTKNLVDVLKSETSGDFKEFLIQLFQSVGSNEVNKVHDALKGGKGVDSEILNNIVFSHADNQEIQDLEYNYRLVHKIESTAYPIRQIVSDRTTGVYRELLRALLICDRRPAKSTPQADAAQLYASQPDRLNRMNYFVEIFSRRTIPHLKQVFKEYERIAKQPMGEAFKGWERSGKIDGAAAKAFTSMVAAIGNIGDDHTVDEIHQSTKKLGTSESKLTRLIVSHSEQDLGTIKDAYAKKYGKTLEQLIESETSGAYKNGLLALVAGNYH